jgi:hypothetical protein
MHEKWIEMFTWKLVLTLPFFHAYNDDPKTTNASIAFGDFRHSQPKYVFAVPTVVEPLDAVELFASWRHLTHFAAHRRRLFKEIQKRSTHICSTPSLYENQGDKKCSIC